MKLNANDHVWIKLNERGEELLQAYVLGQFAKRKGPWARLQLWEVMYAFGKALRIGSESPFSLNMLINEEPPESEAT